jgi:hypothetical protein
MSADRVGHMHVACEIRKEIARMAHTPPMKENKALPESKAGG